LHARVAVLDELARAVAARHLGRPLRVGIDGVDGAGKTMLAGELAQHLANLDRPCLLVSLDHFERAEPERYTRGELSPEGYYLDGFDFDRFRAHVLGVIAPDNAIVLCDGVFMHRPELADLWDATIFVSADLEIAAQRGAERNLAWVDSLDDTYERYRRRYMPAQRRYLDEQRPHERADFVVHNTTLGAPRLERRQPCG
jgi:uridine kinase